MKNILKITFVLIGAIIGAGFASGKEIYIFFFSYGIKGIAGLIISISLIGVIIYYSLKIIVKNKITTYKEFLNEIFKRKEQKQKNIFSKSRTFKRIYKKSTYKQNKRHNKYNHKHIYNHKFLYHDSRIWSIFRRTIFNQ